MTIEFTVPYPARKSAWTKRYGLNAYWSGKNHHVRAADARDLETLVRLCLRQQGVPVRLFEKPVSISFWHNTRMDIDNHAAVEKMVVDALKGWLLRNDDRRHYREKHSFFHDENYMRVVISDEADRHLDEPSKSQIQADVPQWRPVPRCGPKRREDRHAGAEGQQRAVRDPSSTL